MSLLIPEAAVDYLKPDNPRLEELKARYAKVSTDATAPLHWTDSYVTAEEILQFRGDNAYVWRRSVQQFAVNPMGVIDLAAVGVQE